MIYSVYDYTRRQYDYYDAPGPGGTHAGAPKITRTLGGIGAAPERASWKLPPGARKLGAGEMPRGRIASLGSTAGDLGDLGDPQRLAVYALVAYGLWRILR